MVLKVPDTALCAESTSGEGEKKRQREDFQKKIIQKKVNKPYLLATSLPPVLKIPEKKRKTTGRERKAMFGPDRVVSGDLSDKAVLSGLALAGFNGRL